MNILKFIFISVHLLMNILVVYNFGYYKTKS